jgi:tRNA dimethylallyltransferase
MMTPSESRDVVLIAGPTASGKSALALAIARERGGLIVNADALQVYAELRILSARPSDEEMHEAPHSLYGHVSGHEAHSVAQWLREATGAIESAWEQGLVPIVVGGTGLYFKALEEGLADVPEIPLGIREKWRSFEGDIYNELALRDPRGAKRFNVNDRQRLVRALEVIEATGKPLQFWQEQAKANAFLREVKVQRHLTDVPRETLYTQAEARFDRMLREGVLDEVRRVRDFDSELPMMKAIGIPELSAHLRGELTLEAAITDAKTATRNYIKRQFTWWRGQGETWRTV